MQDALRGVPPPGEDSAAHPQRPLPGTARLVLQRSDLERSLHLWDQVFPATSWRAVLAGRAVTVTVRGRRASLLGARNGRLARLGPITGGSRVLTSADLEHDWLWIDGDLRSVAWSVEAEVPLPPVTVVMPTYRREADATAQARRFTRMDLVGTVVVVDQGATMAAHPAFARLQASTQAVRLVTQPNLGGSGGYARGMLEASQDPGSAVLFSDDDALLTEESLHRMLTYQALASLAGRPTIVGSPLFSSQQPTHLITHTEAVRPGVFQWKSADRVRGAVDLSGTSPVDWTFLSQRDEANYTGWWGTLFPPGTAAELGLPVPLFLKWDDAEYGLRATAHGYAHAVLPGTSVHHPPWTAYRTQMSWTARVLHRNRLAIAAGYGAGRGVIASSLLHQLKHILAGHLLTAELWEEGIAAFRAGPEAWLGHDLQHARADGSRVVTAWHGEYGATEPLSPTHRGPLPLVPALLSAATRVVRPDGPPRVVLAVAADSVHWRTTLGADAVLITGDDDAPVSAFMVRGSATRRALVRTLRSHAGMALRWATLRRRYCRALPHHTTADSWAALFAAGPDAAPTERT